MTYGLLLPVFLPAVPARFRRAVSVLIIAVVIVIGLTRIALGVHFRSDVIAGWSLGVMWLGVTAAAFRRWREERALPNPPLDEGLTPERRTASEPAPTHDAAFPQGWTSAAQLVVGAVLVAAAVSGAGVLVTDVIDTSVQLFDIAVVQ